jgi:hypothetical protein
MRNEDKSWLLTDAKGKDSGPFTYTQLKEQYAAKQINGDTLCMPKGLFGASGWKPLSSYFPDFEGEPDTASNSLCASSAVSGIENPDAVARSVMTRYRDAYLVARATTAIGGTVKVVGICLAIFVALAGIVVALSKRGSLPMGIGGLLIGFVFGIPIYVLGILVSAHGQVLKASLDSAVHTTPFLTDAQKLKVMSLP